MTDSEHPDTEFERFNIGDRRGLDVRSMSVGDVVVIDGIAWVCQPAGWELADWFTYGKPVQVRTFRVEVMVADDDSVTSPYRISVHVLRYATPEFAAAEAVKLERAWYADHGLGCSVRWVIARLVNAREGRRVVRLGEPKTVLTITSLGDKDGQPLANLSDGTWEYLELLQSADPMIIRRQGR